MRTILSSPTDIVVQAGENRVEVGISIVQERNEIHIYRLREDSLSLVDEPIGPYHQVAHATNNVHGLTVLAGDNSDTMALAFRDQDNALIPEGRFYLLEEPENDTLILVLSAATGIWPDGDQMSLVVELNGQPEPLDEEQEDEGDEQATNPFIEEMFNAFPPTPPTDDAESDGDWPSSARQYERTGLIFTGRSRQHYTEFALQAGLNTRIELAIMEDEEVSPLPFIAVKAFRADGQLYDAATIGVERRISSMMHAGITNNAETPGGISRSAHLFECYHNDDTLIGYVTIYGDPLNEDAPTYHAASFMTEAIRGRRYSNAAFALDRSTDRRTVHLPPFFTGNVVEEVPLVQFNDDLMDRVSTVTHDIIGTLHSRRRLHTTPAFQHYADRGEDGMDFAAWVRLLEAAWHIRKEGG